MIRALDGQQIPLYDWARVIPWPGFVGKGMPMAERRVAHVGVKMTKKEAELLRRAAFEERTTRSSLLRRLFVERYLRGAHETE